jgi:probable rRNA maturation factor
MKELQVRNRQRDRRVNSRLLRSICQTLLEELLTLSRYEVGIHLVSAPVIAEVNQHYLNHTGPTDVITFDLREPADARRLVGEIYVCVRVAEEQAREFDATWQSELVRYVTHGVLHLLGFDDLAPDQRRVMKREENRLVKALERRFNLDQLAA